MRSLSPPLCNPPDADVGSYPGFFLLATIIPQSYIVCVLLATELSASCMALVCWSLVLGSEAVADKRNEAFSCGHTAPVGVSRSVGQLAGGCLSFLQYGVLRGIELHIFRWLFSIL
ncbi:hypothetical protein P168DRAFT_4777 [Aspergillus campestris IBT 28561]|uniref:Uncharacterized protein n=1 Tax=Aspergillus campestris (strain IBT 28561) TaxID=1392248 RepID=A0A2I1DDI0_ASPC2|nr:uncharacterized protein P168DRAFT_4777 [Aspergillus campestris IBT 28561]PKY07937.1 hypothetical protein P168DRAFT_4777 [Aspergillus campestris IBT 28561]